MKIAWLVPGGVDRSGTHRVIPCLLWLMERITAAGHELHVFARAQEPEPGEWPLLGAKVHNAGRRPRSGGMLAHLVAEHRRGRFDVIHAFWAVPAGVVAAVAGRLLGVPVLLHLPGGDLTSLPEIGYGTMRRRRARALVRVALAGADRVVAPSTYICEQAKAFGAGVVRVPFGVALDRWPPAPPRPREPGTPARLLHVASLNRVKDQDTLLCAAARLRERGIPFRLDVIGVDTLGGVVQLRAAELGLLASVHFHGFLPHDELRPWVSAADLLVVSSRHEAGPLVLQEAAVAGVPTAGTAVGHLVDWAPDAAAAVPVGDPEALAAAIEHLLTDEPARLHMAAKAQHRAMVEDADWTARTILDMYRGLAGLPSPDSTSG